MKRPRIRAIDVGARTPWPTQTPEFAGVPASHLCIPLMPRAREGRAAPIIASGPVRAGERLTDAAARHFAAVHAPVDGRIVGRSRVALPDGQWVDAVEMQAQGTPAPPAPVYAETIRTLETSPAELGIWIDRLIDLGVDAHRLGCPDLLGQLLAALRRPIDTILCNLLPMDDHVRQGAVLAARYPLELVAGVGLLSRLTGALNRWVVAEAGMPSEWARPMRDAARAEGLRLLWMQYDYPLDDPVLLLYALLDRKLRPGRLPTDRGAIVIDAAAAIAIGRCVLLNEPTLAVPIALRDHRRRESHHLFAVTGTRLRDIMTTVGIAADTVEIRAGSVLRDRLVSADAVVGGSELLFQVTAPRHAAIPEACIRCGWCNEACPVRIQPAMLLEASQRDNRAMAERAGLEACIECGICTYICPSELPLMQAIRAMRRRHE